MEPWQWLLAGLLLLLGSGLSAAGENFGTQIDEEQRDRQLMEERMRQARINRDPNK